MNLLRVYEHLNWSMLKSGPKNRFPIKNDAADGVADDMALPRSDCSSSVGAKREKDKFSDFFIRNLIKGVLLGLGNG